MARHGIALSCIGITQPVDVRTCGVNRGMAYSPWVRNQSYTIVVSTLIHIQSYPYRMASSSCRMFRFGSNQHSRLWTVIDPVDSQPTNRKILFFFFMDVFRSVLVLRQGESAICRTDKNCQGQGEEQNPFPSTHRHAPRAASAVHQRKGKNHNDRPSPITDHRSPIIQHPTQSLLSSLSTSLSLSTLISFIASPLWYSSLPSPSNRMTLSASSSCSSSRSSLITLLVATTALSAGAFTAPRVALPSLSATKLSGSKDSINDAEVSRILNAGGGIPVVPAGDCLLWDPAIEGKLGGSGQLEARLSQGSRYDDSFVADTFLETSPADILPVEAQCWLEDLGVPQNFAKPTAPATATVLGRTPVIQPDAPGDIQHVLMRLPEGMHYVEGQSISVIPPGLDSKGKPHKPRLYSIASTRYGDLLDGRTVSLCVRRAEYYDPATKQPDPTKKGICSNYLCDIMPGSKVKVAGPVGKTMLLPEDDPSKDIIMVATGTGIAPFRAFLRRLFLEETIARHAFTGNAWLILGVPTTSGLLYPQEIAEME